MIDPARFRCLRASSLAALLLIFLTWGYGESRDHETEEKGYANASLLMSGEEARHHLNDPGTLVVDVRLPKRYSAGHLLGALENARSGNCFGDAQMLDGDAAKEPLIIQPKT